MDRTMVYSILAVWIDAEADSARDKWCKKQLLLQLLQDENETLKFLRAQRDLKNLEKISVLLPEMAYQLNSWDFVRGLEAIAEKHQLASWQELLPAAKAKIKRPAQG